MSVRNLDKLFHPHRIAVIGATDRPGSVGRTLLHNLIGSGYTGTVYPVNRNHDTVHNIAAYPTVAAVPQTPDLAIVCTPARSVVEITRQCGEAGVGAMIVLAAGFAEIGEEGRKLQEELKAEAARFEGLRILGPNCLGLIVPGSGFNASFAAATPEPGHVAFISQSGALCTSVLDWALAEGVGFSHFISVGNMLDISMGDLIDYLSGDATTKSIILYIESLSRPRQFMSAARAFTRNKPIAVYKAGRFAESAKAAASHTGALAGVDEVYEAAFQRVGVVRLLEVDDMFDCVELLARGKLPRGDRLGIVTNAGGPGVMATDALLARRGSLAALSEQTVATLNAALPPFWSHGNPVDVLGDATAERFTLATRALLDDAAVDAVLVILTPQAMTDPTAVAEAIGTLALDSSKPILATWMGGKSVEDGVRLLNAARVPTYFSPDQAVRAFMYLVSYARNQEILYETPRDIPVSFTLNRQRVKDLFENILSYGSDALSEATSKALLDAYDIPTTKPFAATTPERAVEIARRIGYPVVAKILSPDIVHKTDVGGVMLNLATDDAVRAAFAQITEVARQRRPQAVIEGISLQPMVAKDDGVEMILGARKDPTFGTVLVAGLGGITTELMQDRALGLPPLTERLARRMLESLRAWPLLQGYRGRPACNVDRLIEVLMRVSYLVADYPQIKELDVNPLLVTPKDVVALDARIIMDRDAIARPARPYSHLAICPYPEEFESSARLKDDTPVRLRPIKPEDEPLWHDLLARCSERSIWQRFRYLVPHTTHEVAVRFCFNDYDREMAIVAEIDQDHERKLIGVGRLVADVDHKNAEFAILVDDNWQGKGLGSLLTTYCLDIARRWNIETVYAETTIDNQRMIALMRKTGYQIDTHRDPGFVFGTKRL